MQPIIAVVADTFVQNAYQWHGAKQSYLSAALIVAGVLPVIVPAFGNRVDFDDLLARVDGVMVTGAKTNVHPALYGEEPSAKHEPYDKDRDATSLPLIRAAIDKGVPLFAICRGIQELNVALGGALATEIQEQSGISDHREPDIAEIEPRYALRHDINIETNGCLAPILGVAPVQVNSLHRQAISALAPSLQIEARADDGTIEAVSVIGAKGFALGVQWHPEYWATSDTPSGQLFRAFGDAVRAHQASKMG